MPGAVPLCGGLDAPSGKRPEGLDGKLLRLSECAVEKGLRPDRAVPPPGLLPALPGGGLLSLSRGEAVFAVASRGGVFTALANADVCAVTLLALTALLLARLPLRLRALPRRCWKRHPPGSGVPQRRGGFCLPGEPGRGLPAAGPLLAFSPSLLRLSSGQGGPTPTSP